MSYEYDDRAPVTPINSSASQLTAALENLLAARDNLAIKKSDMPDNLVPGGEDRYLKREQDAYNRAANAYEQAVINSVKGSLY